MVLEEKWLVWEIGLDWIFAEKDEKCFAFVTAENSTMEDLDEMLRDKFKQSRENLDSLLIMNQSFISMQLTPDSTFYEDLSIFPPSSDLLT